MSHDGEDEVAAFNRERWDELARARVQYSVPMLDLDVASARETVDVHRALGVVDGKRVLCLAAGGGQQSAAFGLLGAEVTVLDLSDVQLERDRIAAKHYGRDVTCEQGDMRDLSRFAAESFDLVWQAHSINFVPDPLRVFEAVHRVLGPGGLYRLEFTNPFIHDGDWESSWTGTGYLLHAPYGDGEVPRSEPWSFVDDEGRQKEVLGPREFRHTFGTMINGLIEEGFELLGLWEDARGDPDAEPGSWLHFKAVAAPWIEVVAQNG